MRTAEELVLEKIAMLEGIIKAKRSLEEGKEIEAACLVSITLCEHTRSEIEEIFDSEVRSVDRAVCFVLNKLIGQIIGFKNHPYATEDEKPFYDEFVEAVQCIKEEYRKLKKGEKVCKSILVLQRI